MSKVDLENVQAELNGDHAEVSSEKLKKLTLKGADCVESNGDCVETNGEANGGAESEDDGAVENGDGAESESDDPDANGDAANGGDGAQANGGDGAQANGAPKKKSPLTPTQVKLILTTWDLVKPDLQGHGNKLFIRLFEIAPDLIGLFPFDEPSPEIPEFKKHALDVMDSIDKAVDMLRIGDLDELQEVLFELGIIHHMKDVHVGGFGPVGEALIDTLETGIGADLFTDEAKVAWGILYSLVEKCMTRGMTEGLEVS